MRRVEQKARTAFIMISGSGVGGAEKRFTRMFLHLSGLDDSYTLIINRSLFQALAEHQLGLDESDNVVVLPESLGPLSDAWRRQLYMLLYPRHCARTVAARGIQAVHLLGSGIYYGLPFLFSRRVASVVSLYNVAVDGPVSRAGRPLFRLALRRADAIDILSEDIRRRLLASTYNAGDRLRSRLHVTPCSFADYSRTRTRDPKLDQVVFLGRLDRIKQPMLLVEAMPAILAAHPNTAFLILGRGPLQGEIERRVRELGVDHAVTVRHVSSPEEYLSGSRIFVSLQQDNNYPSQSLLEAMACENAVVATDVGETSRLVDETTGLRVPADITAVAAAVNELLSDPDRCRQLGRSARDRVLAEHTIERAGRYLRELHLSVQR